MGFQLSLDGTLLPVTPLTRKLEVIGDFISFRYGNEATEIILTPKLKTARARTARSPRMRWTPNIFASPGRAKKCGPIIPSRHL
jgi:hypothetical protein